MKKIIYYTSSDVIDKIGDYKKQKIEETITKDREGGFSLGVKGILNFFGIRLGISQKESIKNVVETEIPAIEIFFKNYKKLSICAAGKNISISEEKIFFFNSQIKLLEKFNKKGGGTFIEVSGTFSGINFLGFTSKDNWCAPSMLNGLLFSKEIEASGLFFPLKIDESGEVKTAVVQFLVIANPTLFSFLKKETEESL